MHISLWNVALQTVNFLVLVWLLQRLLFKPVRAALANRQETIAAALREADEKKAEAERAAEDYRRRLAGVAEETARVRREAVAASEDDARRIREEAVRQAQIESDRAMAALERERVAAMKIVEGRAALLAGSLAERLLREALPDSDAPFLWRTTAAIDAQDPRGRAATAQRLASGPVEAVSSRPLDAATRERFERWLSTLTGAPVAARYQVDEALIAGVELRLPSGTWRANWKDSLERMTMEMDAHEVIA